ncbi:MAG TPA: transcription termination/antitermination protein NusA [Halothiobacillaceae bacterium]|nr:transcription termination/antitermination protein NusA [Halothiobacillaceae bacterium]
MSKEILFVVDSVSNEKGVERQVIFEAIEAALAQAARKRHGGDIDTRVEIRREDGSYRTFRRWKVVDADTSENPEREIILEAARLDNPDIQPGEIIEEEIESVEFGRIAAQAAKQVIVQKVREAERRQVVEAYLERKGTLVMGQVKRIDRGNVILDLGGNAEAIIPRDEMIPRESVRSGDRLRGYITDVRYEQRGPQIFVSRTAPEFLMELFKLEVPEIGQGLIDLISASRDPGLRAKIAVASKDPRIDPVGTCVGMRGSRVQSVTNELAGERIDIIIWDENPAQFVINAMSPAEVVSIVVDEDAGSMDVAVSEDNLSKAIGRGGQNVRLASQLTGWQINVMSEEEALKKGETEAKQALEQFVVELDVDQEVGEALVEAGFTTLEEVAYVPSEELTSIEGFDEEIAEELRNRARDALLVQAISGGDNASSDKAAPGDALALEDLEGMTAPLAAALRAAGINNSDDLAELSIDELCEYEGVDETQAGQLIMAARAPWFA